MSQKQPYQPICSLAKLLLAQDAIDSAQTAEELKAAVSRHGPTTGYKAFCYLATGKMSAYQMRPDEAAALATQLSLDGKMDEARAIMEDIVAVHPEHPIAALWLKPKPARK